MSWRILPAAAIAIAVILSACGGSGSHTVTPTVAPDPPAVITIASGQPITIGVSSAMSGDQEALGRDIADAADLAISDAGGVVKGHKIALRREDDGCNDPEKALAAARTLTSIDSIAGVVGPMCTTGLQAADKTYADARVAHITPSTTRVEIAAPEKQYFFRTCWQDDAQARTQAAYARETANAASAIVVEDGEPYGKALADAFVSAFESAGGRVMSRKRIERGTTDFSSLAQQVTSASPDVLVFEGLNPEGVLLAKALRESAFAGQFIGPDALLSERDFILAGRGSVDGAIITGGPIPGDAFVAKFRDRFQRVPATPFVLQSYDAATALIKAIDATATISASGELTIDRVALAATLHQQRFAGLTGTVAFDDRGDRAGEGAHELGLEVYRVTNGRFEPVR